MIVKRFDHYPFVIYDYDVIDSTNTTAKRALQMVGSEANDTVHLARVQTDGRGRRGRSWINTEGAVMMSIVKQTKFGMEKAPILNLVAAVAVRNAMTRLTGGRAELSVKWPNDIVTTERLEKVCGILSELVSIGSEKYAVIGVGLNLNAETIPEDLLQPASSIYLQCGKRTDIMQAVFEILDEFKTQYELMMEDTPAFLKNYVHDCISIGKHLAVSSNGGVRYGVGERIASNGQLVVKYEDGESDIVYAADVSILSQKVMDERLAVKLLPKRKRNSNKGDHGRAAVIVGSPDKPGAALMCTRACLRAGAGLTKALIPNELTASFASVPEAMLAFEADADELIEWAGVIAIGCGMGVNKRTESLLEKALRSGKPLIIDADALNTLAQSKKLMKLLHENCLITPHPGEMARLCGCDTEHVIKHFSETAIAFAREHKCCVLLKSAVSIIVSASGTVRYNESGSDALAKGGSGDVLTGLITGIAAQGAKLYDAASLGSYLLGVSAEKAIELLKTRFVCAGDVIDAISMEFAPPKQ